MKNQKIIIKKYVTSPQKPNTALKIFLISLICFNTVGLIYSIDSSFSHRNEMYGLSSRIETVERLVPYGYEENIDERIHRYYRELSTKTDEAINRIIMIVGILGTAITFFGILLTFKVPRDIERRMDKLSMLISKAEESAKDAAYQAEILEAINMDYNGELTNAKRIQQISKIIKQYSEKPDAYVVRGFIYDQMSHKTFLNKKKEFLYLAISDYEIARKLGGKVFVYFNSMGIAHSRLGNHQEAIFHFTKAIEKKA